MDKIGQAYEMLLTGAALILAVLMIISIIRSVLGPKISDRIIAVNMTGTMAVSYTHLDVYKRQRVRRPVYVLRPLCAVSVGH